MDNKLLGRFDRSALYRLSGKLNGQMGVAERTLASIAAARAT